MWFFGVVLRVFDGWVGLVWELLAWSRKFCAFFARVWSMSNLDKVIGYLEAGVKAEGLRQKAIANNAANINTPGYRTVDVKFEELLAEAIAKGSVGASDMTMELFEPGKTPVKGDGNDVSLEAEVGKMVENSLRHATYVRLLGKKYNQLELAINVK